METSMETTIEKIRKGKYDKRVLTYIANGKRYADIKKKTGLNKCYISYCVKLMLEKFEAKNKAELVVKALIMGFIK